VALIEFLIPFNHDQISSHLFSSPGMSFDMIVAQCNGTRDNKLPLPSSYSKLILYAFESPLPRAKDILNQNVSATRNSITFHLFGSQILI
jgi:hypothetical protein